ncbi:MAG: hypothetical protein U0Q18_08150 [Bryobacteraceae bacterium]
MMRRQFFNLAAGVGAGAARLFAAEARQTVPVTLDLREPMRLAVQCMIHRMDPARNYQPWFAVDVKKSRPVALRHEVWDYGDTSGRFLESFVTARHMIEPTEEMQVNERRIRKFVGGLFGPDGIVHNPEKKQPDHMFAQGSALYALVTDYDDSRDPKLKEKIRAFIAGLGHAARQESDYLWFPQVATSIAPCSHQAAYQVLPVVRFYELTRDEAALHYAERLARWSFYHDPTVTADGVITKTAWEGHLHAWMDTYSGMLRCARAGGKLDRPAVVRRAHLLFEWVKANYTSPFGWVADSVGSQTCETDTITSAIRLALELIREGWTGYWDDIERFVRNQLIENQFRDVSRLGIQDPVLALGLTGAFEAYAAPNTLIAVEQGTIEGCCISGGMRGLFLAYQNAIQETPEEIRVNLLLNAGTKALEVASYMPYEGRIDLHPNTAKTIAVRCPSWLEPNSVRIDGAAGIVHDTEPKTRYLKLSNVRPGSAIVLRFDQPEHSQKHVVAGRTYHAQWRGDTVLAMDPPGVPYPIFQRDQLRARRSPMTERTIAYRVPSIRW